MKLYDEDWGQLTTDQQNRLREVYCRKDNGMTFEDFLNKAYNDRLMGCVMVEWSGMWLGIEPDGHCHS